MTFTVIVDTRAERDWQEAVSWYEEREPGTSHRLNIAIRDVLHVLARNPERFQFYTRLTQKAKVPAPWPYSVFFTINKAHREIKIVAIWHGARNPEELRRRMK